MCGIAGVLVVHNAGDAAPAPLEAIPEAWLDALDDGIKHRGPDGEGRFRDRAVRGDGAVVDVAIVHRRLSIIDHSGGHQPMVHDGERLRPDLTYARGEPPILASDACRAAELVAVGFNGCLYNHRSLRTELERLGHRFETDHSDTEVLLHAWRRHGPAVCDHLDAMHASLFWSREQGRLAWSRDPAGEKPLYTSRPSPAVLLVSSGVAGMLGVGAVDGGTGRRPNEHARAWLAMGRSFKLPVEAEEHPPGAVWSAPETHAAEEQRSLRDRRSDERPAASRREQGAPRDAAIVDALEHAVASRLEADAPLGLFLSGGLDSALIAAIARRHRPEIKAFTVRMPSARFDESHDAAATADALRVEHTLLDCDPAGAAADLVRLVEQLGLPFGDSSLLPTYWVCKAASDHVKVALAGDGADELFGGYRRHTIAPALNRWHSLLGLIPDRLLDRRTPGSRPAYLARLATAARHGGYPELTAVFQTPELAELLGPSTTPTGFQYTDDPLTHDFDHYLPSDLLRKTDTASMAVPIEVRAPFLSKSLVEAAMRTPLGVLMPWGRRKGLLKELARRHLPEHVIDRPKRGFAIPIGEWFRTDFGGLRGLLHDHLRSADPFPGLADAGVLIDRAVVERLLLEHDRAGEWSLSPWRGRDHSQRLYALLVLSIWAKWLRGRSRPVPAS
ncbi:MAG: asparagine synthase (glutamine-hydrolyzing) [Planctomycetota bacterium]